MYFFLKFSVRGCLNWNFNWWEDFAVKIFITTVVYPSFWRANYILQLIIHSYLGLGAFLTCLFLLLVLLNYKLHFGMLTSIISSWPSDKYLLMLFSCKNKLRRLTTGLEDWSNNFMVKGLGILRSPWLFEDCSVFHRALPVIWYSW